MLCVNGFYIAALLVCIINWTVLRPPALPLSPFNQQSSNAFQPERGWRRRRRKKWIHPTGRKNRSRYSIYSETAGSFYALYPLPWRWNGFVHSFVPNNNSKVYHITYVLYFCSLSLSLMKAKSKWFFGGESATRPFSFSHTVGPILRLPHPYFWERRWCARLYQSCPLQRRNWAWVKKRLWAGWRKAKLAKSTVLYKVRSRSA